MKYSSSRLVKVRSGDGWRGVLSYKDEEGKWRQVSHRLKSDKEGDAKRELALWWADMERKAEDEERQGTTKPDAASRTVADLANEAFEEQLASGSVEPSSMTAYRAAVRNVELHMGDVPIADLKPADLERMQASIRKAGLAPSTVRKARVAVSAAVHRARKLGVDVADPLPEVKAPKDLKVKKGNNVLAHDQRERLSNHLKSMEDTPLKVGCLLALRAGLRAQEACGLQWGDWDEERGLLWLKRAIGRAKGGEYVKELKSDERRTVPVDAELSAALRGLKASSTGLWVLSPRERWLSPCTLSRKWSALAECLGLMGTEGRRPCFHDLRRTYITVAVRVLDVKTVSAIVGHKDAGVTLNVYAAVDEGALDEARRLVSERL